MLVVGLTGSIGMGKSSALSYLRAKGLAVFDADEEVHKIYAGQTAKEIERAFHGTTTEKGVDRQLLSEKLAHDPSYVINQKAGDLGTLYEKIGNFTIRLLEAAAEAQRKSDQKDAD